MRGEFIDLNGERIYYYAAGTRGAGDPILLIHGFPSSSHIWFDVVPKLPAGHRVIVVDLPGFGRSDPSSVGGGQLASHAIRVALLLNALQIEKACVVGHGAGAAIAQLMASMRQSVSSLGIVGCGLMPYPPLSGGLLSVVASFARHIPGWIWLPLVRREIARGYVDGERGHRSADVFLRPFGEADGGRFFARHLSEIRGGESVMASVPPRISVPTAILAGRNDPFVSLDAIRALQQAIPGSRLHICDAQRHFLPEEAPSEVAAMIAELLLPTPPRR